MIAAAHGATMHFSVIICTRDRAAALRNVLASIARADRPNVEWELLVVDNGSTDNTPAVVDSYRDTLPIRRVYEPQAGLSNARNRGVSEARGTFVLWTDDDVLVRQEWLTAFAEAFQAHPDAAIFGGCILPLYAEPKADWFIAAEDELGSLLAYRNFSGPISADCLPFGACYAVRAAEQRTFQYDPNLGVAPGRRSGGEESAVLQAILEAGGRGVWVEKGIVDHVISPERQTIAYIFAYYRAQGQLHGARRGTPGQFMVGRVPLCLWIHLVRSYVGYRLRRAAGAEWVGALAHYARMRGVVDSHRSPVV